MRCYKCNGVHEQNVKNFTIGNVIFCPHCNKSTVIRDNLNFHIRTLLKDSTISGKTSNGSSSNGASVNWRNSSPGAPKTLPRSRRTRSASASVSATADIIGDTYDAAGKPYKKGSRFSWG